MSEETLLLCHFRTARNKAKDAALAEVAALLHDLHPSPQPGGPLSERGGLFWVTVPTQNLDRVVTRLPRLGYTSAVDALVPLSDSSARRHRSTGDETVKWRGERYGVQRIYEDDEDALRERAPDRRRFLIEGGDGEVREVQGYRGDGSEGHRRGLPVYDARFLVNLAQPERNSRFLDPFAGIGGIVLEAREAGCAVYSADNDPLLRHGLARQGARHVVADARRLPFGGETFPAIATEPPYHADTLPWIGDALREMCRVCANDGRIAMLCAEAQVGPLREAAGDLGLHSTLDTPINRKGLGVHALAWRKSVVGGQ